MNISIVMPAYNSSEYIKETITSVMGQTHREWELIIVDDASTDDTVEIIESYMALDSRIKLIKLEANFGAPAGPRNRGVINSIYDWIAFIDSDDLWHVKKLEQQIRVIVETKAQFVSSQMMRFSLSTYFDCSSILDDYIPFKRIPYLRQLLRYGTPTSSVLVKKEIMINFPFEEDISWRAREDLDCWLKIHKHIEYSVKLECPLVGYRVVSGQISGNKLEMIRRTYFCLSNSKGVPKSPFGVLAIALTFSHFLGALVNRIAGDKL